MDNMTVIRQAFKQYEKEVMEPAIEKTLFDWCQRILSLAVDFRLKSPNGHNFTGNLINSIVVVLYARDKGFIPFYASDLVKKPIAPEMSATSKSGNVRTRRYGFHPDWSQRDSYYMPELETDRSTGDADARAFVSYYQPTLRTKYTIVVAYTSEYADWVEQQNKTTGYLYMLKSTGKAAIDFVGLRKADNLS